MNNIRQFLKRNMSLLVLAAMLALAFVILIGISQNKQNETKLADAPPESANFEITGDEKQPTQNIDQEPLDLEAPVEKEEAPAPKPVVQVTFTDEGFVPEVQQAALGQTVRWTNATDQEITLVQVIDKFDEFEEGLTIAPGESFELELYNAKLWTYEEINSGIRTRMIISQPVTRL